MCDLGKFRGTAGRLLPPCAASRRSLHLDPCHGRARRSNGSKAHGSARVARRATFVPCGGERYSSSRLALALVADALSTACTNGRYAASIRFLGDRAGQSNRSLRKLRRPSSRGRPIGQHEREGGRLRDDRRRHGGRAERARQRSQDGRDYLLDSSPCRSTSGSKPLWRSTSAISTSTGNARCISPSCSAPSGGELTQKSPAIRRAGVTLRRHRERCRMLRFECNPRATSASCRRGTSPRCNRLGYGARPQNDRRPSGFARAIRARHAFTFPRPRANCGRRARDAGGRVSGHPSVDRMRGRADADLGFTARSFEPESAGRRYAARTRLGYSGRASLAGRERASRTLDVFGASAEPGGA